MSSEDGNDGNDATKRDSFDSDVAALAETVSSLAVSTESAEKEEPFVGVRDALSKFATIRDLGMFVWRPHSPSREDLQSFGSVTVEDVRARLDPSDNPKGVPVLSLTGVTLPVIFPRSKPQPVVNRFPNDPGVVAALAAAATRGLKLDAVDFVFGGSALNVLSARDTGDKVYLVQRVGEAIVVAKHSEYTGDLAARGFMFERLVTGARMNALGSEDSVVGMQEAHVGAFRVFFHAEVDAVTADGARVEITSGNPEKFGTRQLLQMVSSRSTSLVFARCRGNKLLDIDKCTLGEVAAWVPRDRRLALQEKLIDAMCQLKDLAKSVREDEPSQLMFDDEGCVRLRPRPNVALLPSQDVLAALMDV